MVCDRSGAPVFILASPRSFTSVLCMMLGQHPQAEGFPEVNLLLFDTMEEFLERARGQHQFLIHGLLRVVAQLYAGEQTVRTIDMARRWVHRRRHQTTQVVYRELTDRLAPQFIIDKSPAYPSRETYLRRIPECFPEARFLYLVRNPIDQGLSMMRAPQGIAELLLNHALDFQSNPPSLDPQVEWFQTQTRILTFLENIPEQRKFSLMGETLLQSPEPVLHSICEWLELPWSEAISEALLHPERSPYACMGPYGAPWGNNPGFQKAPSFRRSSRSSGRVDRDVPWRETREKLQPEVLALASALGYEGGEEGP
ncbi:MAG: sulfotransferase [Okeania sp. SIO3H1]|nr:sulfotransferase [Okeania sp. SIO3H1]